MEKAFANVCHVPWTIFCRDNLGSYASEYPARFILGYCSTYIFMQTFMIPGTIFMSLLAGALFGVVRGFVLVVLNATAGACSCFFLSKLVGRPLVCWLWPEKLRFFQAEVTSPMCLTSFNKISCYYEFTALILFWTDWEKKR